MSKMKKNKPLFKVGDWVTFAIGSRKVLVQSASSAALLAALGLLKAIAGSRRELRRPIRNA
jgi:hypothetical protein